MSLNKTDYHWSKLGVDDISKIDINTVNENGYSAIHYLAAYNTNPAVIEIVIESIGNVNDPLNLKDKQGHTPLDHAIYAKNINVIQKLLILGAKHSLDMTKISECEK